MACKRLLVPVHIGLLRIRDTMAGLVRQMAGLVRLRGLCFDFCTTITKKLITWRSSFFGPFQDSQFLLTIIALFVRRSQIIQEAYNFFRPGAIYPCKNQCVLHGPRQTDIMQPMAQISHIASYWRALLCGVLALCRSVCVCSCLLFGFLTLAPRLPYGVPLLGSVVINVLR